MDVLYPHCAGLDVHKDTVVACVRHVTGGKVIREVRTFKTVTTGLLALSEWLASGGCTQVVMEATGVYWKPVWHILSDGEVALTLANAAHVRNVPGRKSDTNDSAPAQGRLVSRPVRDPVAGPRNAVTVGSILLEGHLHAVAGQPRQGYPVALMHQRPLVTQSELTAAS